jgi:hypothetical protein
MPSQRSRSLSSLSTVISTGFDSLGSKIQLSRVANEHRDHTSFEEYEPIINAECERDSCGVYVPALSSSEI